MLGFVNGLAVVIFLAQLGQFKAGGDAVISSSEDAHAAEHSSHSALNVLFDGGWMQGTQLYIMLGLTALTMLIIWGFPKLPKVGKMMPSALVAIVTVSLMVIGLDLDTKTVGDLASVSGGWPSFHIPVVPFTWETIGIILPVAVILAAIGLIESLLTLTLIDEITETRGRTSQECVGQGLGNAVSGLFGAMGGCAMIGQSMINIESGGRGRLSGISAALALLGFILFAGPLIEQIPLAALTGLMFMVVIATFAWTSLKIMRHIPKEDAFVIILVTAVTIWQDLALAVIIGVIVSSLAFAWKAAHNIFVIEGRSEDGTHKVYKLHGPLFFGSITKFKELFNPKNDENESDIVIDFANARVWDHSALEAIDSMASKYKEAGKTLHLVHLSPDCKILLKKAGDFVEINQIEDPHYRVVADYG
jgi:SulP family sulfate permease